jgi:hypothetical protein
MILTQCAVCATELGLSLGKKCGRCSTRYCGPECQVQHWKEGGHDNICKKIKKAGGAEQYNANTKYTEAVAVAAEACADDTKGQKCYICTQALHWKTKEGLVRMCACRGTAGFAHVSCLAEQAKILFAEAEENNLDPKVQQAKWTRWHTCGLCEQEYVGVVRCALGWACWKTYVGRPETGWALRSAMKQLGNGLGAAGHHEDALSVRETELSTLLRLGVDEEVIFAVKQNLAGTYKSLGRLDDCLRTQQDAYSGLLKLYGEDDMFTLGAANNYASILGQLERFEEAKSLMKKTMPVARRVLGDHNSMMLRMRWSYARALCEDVSSTSEDLREAVTTLEDAAPTARRVLGGAHPITGGIEECLRGARATLHAHETGDVSLLREGIERVATRDAK